MLRRAVVFSVFLAAFFFVTLRAASAAPKTDLERGKALLTSKGCTACHSTDGTPRVGPSFLGFWGSTRKVLAVDASTKEVVADDAYLARSLRDPDAEVAVGFPRGNMPKLNLTDDEVHAIGVALASMKTEEEPSTTKRGGSILPLAISSAAFALLHFFLSAIPIRKKIIGALNDKAFKAIYSLIALGTFGAMMWFYRTAPYIEVWSPPRFMRWVPVLTMPFAILLMVAGFSTPNPTSVGQQKQAKEDAPPRGIVAVTRHPGLWGFALWGMAHIAANGELHVILVALSIVVLAIGGMLHIDARRRVDLGGRRIIKKKKTSVVPFGAMITAHTKLRFSEIGIVRVLIAGFLYMTILHTHAITIGASPFP